MTPLDIDRIRQVDDFDSLIIFLRDELEWPLQAEDIEELSFDYEPEELGLSEDVAVKINFIKQLRPLAENQPWGIFYIDFEPKKLPVVVLRRVLQKLVIKKRPTAKSSNIPGWQMNDLLFINAFGETEERGITFAHFKQENEDQLPTLKVIGWDGQDTPLHIDRCADELGYLRFAPDIDAESWRSNWSQAFTTVHRHSITTSKKLAQQLAELAKTIRINAQQILRYETEGGRFKKAMTKFKTALIHDLTEDDFADMYAQTIAYGLLYTAIRSHVSGEATVVSAERVRQLVLPTNPFLKEVMESFFDIGARRWSPEVEKLTGIDFDELGINDIVAILKDERTDFDAILRDFGNKNPNEDPVIHFYELFLKEYDALKRKSRGVYYTPKPVVSFIVRSVDEGLKRDFGLELGLADTTTWGQMHKKNPDIKIPNGVSEDDFFVQVLDPALGTGTFLVEVIDLIHNTMIKKWQTDGKSKSDIEQLWNRYVPDKLLPRLYGFELMMAPYAIAHMKIGIKLFETGYQNFQQDNKRVRVYLTNTLEEPVDTTEYLDTLDPAMAEETRQANEIKKKNAATIIIGNPPYAQMSQNLGEKQRELVAPYRFVNGNRIRERGAIAFERNLQDDYVKFLRFAEICLTEAGLGVCGLITNHTFLSNITLRGMRYHLLDTFAVVRLLDLHGNSTIHEIPPDGQTDENVFDIQQGVVISFWLRLQPSSSSEVIYAELWGPRTSKYDRLLKIEPYSGGLRIEPKQPNYLLIPYDTDLEIEYRNCPSLADIFDVFGSAITTARDKVVVDFEDAPIISRVEVLQDESLSDSQILSKLKITESAIWNVANARNRLRDVTPCEHIVDVAYRPFDRRRLFYHDSLVSSPRHPTMRHMRIIENISLAVCRQQSVPGFRHVFVSQIIFDEGLVSNRSREKTATFPLYICPESNTFHQNEYRHANLKQRFTEALCGNLKLQWLDDGAGDLRSTVGPDDILNYIYGQLYSQEYRDRYIGFLKTDFPRVFLTKNLNLFQSLCQLGKELVALHLLESDKLNNHITTFPVSGDNAVSKVGETKKKLRDVQNGRGQLYINKTQYFDNLPEEVWNFHIGGYQVCYKWLADRKKAGRKLSAEDIEHYHKIVVAINETIKIMNQIDEVIEAHGGWPIG